MSFRHFITDVRDKIKREKKLFFRRQFFALLWRLNEEQIFDKERERMLLGVILVITELIHVYLLVLCPHLCRYSQSL